MTRKPIFIFVALLAALNFVFTSCGSNKPSTKSNLSPSETFKTFRASMHNHDVEGFKKTVSRSFYQKVEAGARESKKPLDDSLAVMSRNQDFIIATGFDGAVRDGKIEGDKATVEWQSPSGEWQPSELELIKEDGEWKVDPK